MLMIDQGASRIPANPLDALAVVRPPVRSALRLKVDQPLEMLRILRSEGEWEANLRTTSTDAVILPRIQTASIRSPQKLELKSIAHMWLSIEKSRAMGTIYPLAYRFSVKLTVGGPLYC